MIICNGTRHITHRVSLSHTPTHRPETSQPDTIGDRQDDRWIFCYCVNGYSVSASLHYGPVNLCNTCPSCLLVHIQSYSGSLFYSILLWVSYCICDDYRCPVLNVSVLTFVACWHGCRNQSDIRLKQQEYNVQHSSCSICHDIVCWCTTFLCDILTVEHTQFL